MDQIMNEKSLSGIIEERRATDHFLNTIIPVPDLSKIMEAGRQAPSGYNLQPWRFVIVQEPAQKEKLRAAAMGQPKVGEASAVIVACGDPDAWRKEDLDKMIHLAEENGYGDVKTHESVKNNIKNFLMMKDHEAGGLRSSSGIWVNRHVMIAFTHMMLMAEALGYDTAPMEGFHENKVKEVLGIPENVYVVALLAIGRHSGLDKRYGGRFELSHVFFSENWQKPFEKDPAVPDASSSTNEEAKITAAGETTHANEVVEKSEDPASGVGDVVVRGTVASLDEKERIEETLRSCEGVSDVDNQMRVPEEKK